MYDAFSFKMDTKIFLGVHFAGFIFLIECYVRERNNVEIDI